MDTTRVKCSCGWEPLVGMDCSFCGEKAHHLVDVRDDLIEVVDQVIDLQENAPEPAPGS